MADLVSAADLRTFADVFAALVIMEGLVKPVAIQAWRRGAGVLLDLLPHRAEAAARASYRRVTGEALPDQEDL